MKHMTRIMSLLVLIAVAAIGVATPFLHPISPEARAESGQLDLRHANLQERTHRLDGEWAFYWRTLFDPTQPVKPGARAPAPTHYMTLPGVWNHIQDNGDDLPTDGYATYRLTILLPEHTSNTLLALYVPGITAAYRLYIDDKQMASRGAVGTTPDTMEPEEIPQIVFFTPSSDRVQLTIQTSNFVHRNSGIWRSISIGHHQAVLAETERLLAKDLILIGVLAAMGIYHLG